MTTISSTSAAATPSTYVNPVAATSSHSSLSKTVTRLGLDSSVVATLGGNTSTTPLYNAVGLLNTISHASASNSGSSASGSTSSSGASSNASSKLTAAQAAQASAEQAVLDPLTPSSSSSVSSSGTTTSSAASAANVNKNWASILAATPSAAGTLTADDANQAILSTINTTA